MWYIYFLYTRIVLTRNFYSYSFVGLAAGAVDENDFIRAYTDTPTVQVGATFFSLHCS